MVVARHDSRTGAGVLAALTLLVAQAHAQVQAQVQPQSTTLAVQAAAGFDSPLEVDAIAEQRLVEPGRDGIDVVRYVLAAQVRLGEHVHYTLRVRNTSSSPVERAVIVRALPSNTRYIAPSAVGPGAEVTFSADGGASFATANELRVSSYLGPPRRATADDYTHIRWSLRRPLAPGATALLRFRAEFR